MAPHELPDLFLEAEIAKHAVARLGVALDDHELLVRQRARLLEDRVGDRELADVVHESAGGERAHAAGRETELLADLDRAERYAARVLLRVLVLLREADREGANVGAEERLLGCNQVAADGKRRPAREGDEAVVADQNPGRRDPVQREQSRHRGERGADEDGAAVAALGADDRQRNCGDGCDGCSQADRGEVELAGELNLLLGEEVHRRQRDSRQRSSDHEEGHDVLGSAAGPHHSNCRDGRTPAHPPNGCLFSAEGGTRTRSRPRRSRACRRGAAASPRCRPGGR
jgi:hypothetical protein